MIANRTRGARGGLKLNPTLGLRPAARLADSAAKPKEKTLLAFLICAREILFQKGKSVFSSVFCLQVFGSWRGLRIFVRGRKLFKIKPAIIFQIAGNFKRSPRLTLMLIAQLG